jgi:hypothetical protein
MHVASLCFKCFTCIIGMLQLFHMDVAKVGRDVHMLQWLYTYVASFCFQCFICFCRHMLQVCLFECCIYFIHMLELFYPDVAYVLPWLSGVFLQVF